MIWQSVANTDFYTLSVFSKLLKNDVTGKFYGLAKTNVSDLRTVIRKSFDMSRKTWSS